jgi:hypothetical protein
MSIRSYFDREPGLDTELVELAQEDTSMLYPILWRLS